VVPAPPSEPRRAGDRDRRTPPNDEEIAAVPTDGPYSCPYDGRAFATERARDLHVGRQHPDACTGAERGPVRGGARGRGDRGSQAAVKAVAALVALYFGLLFAYAVLG
jgi:hypothetical protein